MESLVIAPKNFDKNLPGLVFLVIPNTIRCKFDPNRILKQFSAWIGYEMTFWLEWQKFKLCYIKIFLIFNWNLGLKLKILNVGPNEGHITGKKNWSRNTEKYNKNRKKRSVIHDYSPLGTKYFNLNLNQKLCLHLSVIYL